MSRAPQHSIVAPEARVAGSAKIGAFCRIHPRVVIEEDVEIGDHCVIGHPTPRADGSPLVIRRGSLIRSHSVLYEGSSFGPGLTTGHHVTLREGIAAGEGAQFGSYSEILGDLEIGDHVRAHSRVLICQGSVIEDFAWIFPGTVFAEDRYPPCDEYRAAPHVHRYAVIGVQVTLMPGVVVGEGALVASASLVRHDVEPGMVVAGVPARPLGHTSELEQPVGSGQPAYPWRRHFHRGYPEDVVARWKEEFGAG